MKITHYYNSKRGVNHLKKSRTNLAELSNKSQIPEFTTLNQTGDPPTVFHFYT